MRGHAQTGKKRRPGRVLLLSRGGVNLPTVRLAIQHRGQHRSSEQNIDGDTAHHREPQRDAMTDLSAEFKALASYRPSNKVRFVTAAALFDGHDAAINIMRRILMSMGVEVIHLGHNRSVDEIVTAALQEDVQGIAISSYQGGHVEFFKYMLDLLKQRGGGHIKLFGGGGGVIVADEIRELQEYGVARIYSPEDGQRMGLQGMINDMLARCDFDQTRDPSRKDPLTLAQTITALELKVLDPKQIHEKVKDKTVPVLGIT